MLDLIATARTFDDAYGWISAAVGRRLTTPELLGKALAARSRVRWRGWVTAALQDAADGVHSPLERRYLHGVGARTILATVVHVVRTPEEERPVSPGRPLTKSSFT